MTNREKLVWLAGLLEGEGSFYCSPDSKRLAVFLRMTDEDVVRKAAVFAGALCGAAFTTTPYLPKTGASPDRRREVWCLNIYSREARRLMEMILPYMGRRRTTVIVEALRRNEGQVVIEAVGRGKRRGESALAANRARPAAARLWEP